MYFATDGGIRVLDCIEFNERFRCADVCADVAFLAMDLAAHGRVDLAERMLASYAREAGDFELYAVVDFYESYRAFVRGKVASMLANDEGADPLARGHAAQEARRYFLLAPRPIASPSCDRRSCVGGLIASGKSAIADRLSMELGAPVVEADRTRKGMLGVEALRPLDDPAWAGAYDPAVQRSRLRRALSPGGGGPRVGAPGRDRRVLPLGGAPARGSGPRESRGVPFRFVECRTTPEVCKERLVARARQRGVSDGRLAIFDAFRARYEPVTELGSDEHVVLDTSGAPDRALARVRDVVPTWPRGFLA